MKFEPQIFVPVRNDGIFILDNGGDVIATCGLPQIAELLARIINKDAGL